MINQSLVCFTRFLSTTKFLSGVVYVEEEDWLAWYVSSSACLGMAITLVTGMVWVLDTPLCIVFAMVLVFEALGMVRLNTWMLS